MTVRRPADNNIVMHIEDSGTFSLWPFHITALFIISTLPQSRQQLQYPCDGFLQEQSWSNMHTEIGLADGNLSYFIALQLDLLNNNSLLAILGSSVVKVETFRDNPTLYPYIGLPDKSARVRTGHKINHFGSGLDVSFGTLTDMVQISQEEIVVIDAPQNCLKSINRTSGNVILFSGACGLNSGGTDGPSLTTARYRSPDILALYGNDLYIMEKRSYTSILKHIDITQKERHVSTIYDSTKFIGFKIISADVILLNMYKRLRWLHYNRTQDTWVQGDNISLPESILPSGDFTLLSKNTVGYITAANELTIFNICTNKSLEICAKPNAFNRDGNLTTCRLAAVKSLLYVDQRLYIGEIGYYGGGLRSIDYQGDPEPGCEAELFSMECESWQSTASSEPSTSPSVTERTTSNLNTIRISTSPKTLDNSESGGALVLNYTIGGAAGAVIIVTIIILTAIILTIRLRKSSRRGSTDSNHSLLTESSRVTQRIIHRPLPNTPELQQENYYELSNDGDNIYLEPTTSQDNGIYPIYVVEKEMDGPRNNHPLNVNGLSDAFKGRGLNENSKGFYVTEVTEKEVKKNCSS